ncbi:MAG: hypothetical protein Q8865_04975 [Bacillota bacterium]|nr:hypothetical protein [Bacillota bacterium]
MKNNDYLNKILSQFTVSPARESDISQTVLMGQNELYRLRRSKTPRMSLVLEQLKFISPLLWVTQLLTILLMVILSVNLMNPYLEVRQILFTITPLLALFAAPELIKSVIYDMSELENVCKNSASKVLLARFIVIGCANLVAITIVTGIVSARYGMTFTQVILYGLVPFNIVNGLNLLVFDLFKVHSSFIAMAVSLCSVVMMKVITELSFFAAIGEIAWSILFLSTALWLLAELCRFMRSQTEREEYLQWN